MNDGKAAGTGALVWTGIAGVRDRGIDLLLVGLEMRRQASAADLTQTDSPPSLRLREPQC